MKFFIYYRYAASILIMFAAVFEDGSMQNSERLCITVFKRYSLGVVGVLAWALGSRVTMLVRSGVFVSTFMRVCFALRFF